MQNASAWVRCARPSARLVHAAVSRAAFATDRFPPAPHHQHREPGRARGPARRMLSAGPKLSTGDGYVKGQADSSTDIALEVRGACGPGVCVRPSCA